MEDEEYKESEISKKVKELMDDGYEFGDAVREALKEGFADGGSIGIEVLFKPKRQELFMGGPALTGAPLAIYNSMKAYDAFTDQEIADAIKQAGYDLPTADSGTTTPPDSTPDSSNQSGGDGPASMPASMGGIGYSPEQNVLDFQTYQAAQAAQDRQRLDPRDNRSSQEIQNLQNAQKDYNTLQSLINESRGDIGKGVGQGIYDLRDKANEAIMSAREKYATETQYGGIDDDEEDLNTFGKIKGGFNTGIRSLMNSPIGKVAGFAINPAIGVFKGIAGAFPKAEVVGRVGNKNIYGVGSFGGVQGSINKENQIALNKTGNFTNFQLGNMTDPGRVAGNPATNVFAGMNAQSQFGDISKGAQKRIDTISKTLEKQKKAGKTPSKVLTERKAKFEKQLMEHNKARVASRKDKSGSGKKSGFTNPGAKSYGPHSGGGGGGNGCFLKGTLITMLDGTRKPVEQVDLGDKVAVGGKVFAVGRFLNTELYDYKGIKVSGSHMVNEDGTWMRVRDTKHGKSLGNDENTVYVFGSENRRILINDILFTDYFEIEDQEQLLKEEDKFFDNWKTFANNEDIKNVNTLNAS